MTEAAPIRVTHLVGSPQDTGAGRGAYRLHCSLEELGVASHFVMRGGQAPTKSVTSLHGQPWRRVALALGGLIDSLPLRFYSKRRPGFFSTAIAGIPIGSLLTGRDADIVHLHWMGDGFLSVGQVAAMRRPLVWTMRDMWPFTGGCHYTVGCERYFDGCGQCPILGSEHTADLSRFNAWRKMGFRKERIRLVAISSWLAECAARSAVFRDWPITVIPNSVDTRLYRPIDKYIARRVLGLQEDAVIVAFGAVSVGDVRKGAAYLADAMRKLQGTKVQYLVFGKGGSHLRALVGDLEGRIHFLGSLQDDISLMLAYAAADTFVAPSTQEAFGKTIIEAMACGRPVVAFDATGPKDIIAHGSDGYLAKLFDAEDLVQGILWVVDPVRNTSLGNAARDKACLHYDDVIIAKRYLTLYEDILNKPA